MSRQLNAFISYRRYDHFMLDSEGKSTDFRVIDNVKAALKSLGYVEVFVDTSAIEAGDRFEGRIHNAIEECDLFIELIGNNWQGLLDERQRSEETDILEFELIDALALEKYIVPFRVDNAPHPSADRLPATIAELAKIDSKRINSSDAPDVIAAILKRPSEIAAGERRLGRGWDIGYGIFAVVAWLVCAILPNYVGLREFNAAAWFGLASAWSAFFIWPIFFFPLILLALQRPFQILIEAALNARSRRDAGKLWIPLVLGLLFAVPVTFIEISAPQVPWTVHPKVAEQCKGPTDDGPDETEAQAGYAHDRKVVSQYAQIPRQYAGAFWAKNKCWPNVFFYLTVPIKDTARDEPYQLERSSVQQSFGRLLGLTAHDFVGTHAPYSYVFPAYVLSFFILIWMLFSAIMMAIVYAKVSFQRKHDGKVLAVPNEDAFLCLSYAFITLMVWIPFRVTTTWTKALYGCADTLDGCAPHWSVFAKDITFGLGLMVGYVALSIGVLWNHRRLLLAFLGTVAVATCAALAYIIYRYHDAFREVAGHWQFWGGVSLLACLVLIGLWLQFDPSIVRYRDVDRLRRKSRSMIRAGADRIKDGSDAGK